MNNNKDILNNQINLHFDIKNSPNKIIKLNEINKALKELEKQNRKLNQISKEEIKIENNNNILIDKNNKFKNK